VTLLNEVIVSKTNPWTLYLYGQRSVQYLDFARQPPDFRILRLASGFKVKSVVEAADGVLSAAAKLQADGSYSVTLRKSSL